MKIQKEWNKVKYDITINYKDIINQIISIVGILLIIIEFAEIMRSPLVGKMGNQLIIQNLLIIIVIVFINIHSIINKLKASKLEILNKNLLEVNDKVRCFRHDFNNILQAIDSYITLKDLDSLQSYFNSLIKECNYINEIDFLNSRIKENPAISGLLLSKYKIAEEHNIKMNIEILVDLAKFKKRSYRISRVLGILLDNAIEACVDADNKIINVTFMKEERKNRVIIKVENTYIDKEIDIGKIFEKEYTTKTGNSGLGLWKVKDILRKDTKLDLFTTKDEYMFKQQLEIYG